MPLSFATFVALFGFAFFAVCGAYLGKNEERLKVEMRQKVYEGFEKSASKEELEEWSVKAYERLEKFHGHGFSVVLAMFALSFIIANIGAGYAVKQVLTVAASASGLLYSLGWLFAGYYTPRMGFRGAKRFANRWFFAPFGSIMVAACIGTLLLYIAGE